METKNIFSPPVPESSPEQISLTIDGKAVTAQPGERILAAALRNGIWIPNLCFLPDAGIAYGGCRLCWVEIEGKARPVTACSEPVKEGMRVTSRGEEAERLRRSSFELLLSRHRLDCKNCPANKRCGLQEIARKCGYKLRTVRFSREDPGLAVDDSHPLFTLDPNRCVLCGRCVEICRTRSVGILDFSRRGLRCRISTFNDQPLGESECNGCLACVDVCPVGSLFRK